MYKFRRCNRLWKLCAEFGAGNTFKNCVNTGTIKSINGGAAGIRSNFVNTYNCCNLGKAIAGDLLAGYKGVGGISSGAGSDGGAVVNCCSSGQLRKLSGTSLTQSGFVAKRSTCTNCYYLDGIDENIGLTPEAGTTVFYKTSDDPEVMTSAKVVQALNDYIDAHLNDEDATTNTSTWLRWRVGTNGLPELIFE